MPARPSHGHAPVRCGDKFPGRHGAHAVTRSLGGRWYGRYGVAPCPVCQPERRKGQNALSLAEGRDGQLLAHCKRLGCSFADIAAAAGLRSGDYAPPDPAELAWREAERQAEVRRKADKAQACWRQSMPIAGTLAERYLREARAISVDHWPNTLRFHPEAWHGATAQRWPAMVARVEGGASFAIHRTYLRRDGLGKAEVDPAKAMLGTVAGGAVRLTSGPGRLVVAEGIETALSLACGLLEGPVTVWAALSTSGMAGLRLPDIPGLLTIAPDGDRAGRAAALTLADRAARGGWQVSIVDPGDGRDFNDVLRGEVTE